MSVNFDTIIADIKRLYKHRENLENIIMTYNILEITGQHRVVVYGLDEYPTVRAYKKIEKSREFWKKTHDYILSIGFEVDKTIRK